MKNPSSNYIELVNALKRIDWIIFRQKGSHNRIHKGHFEESLKITIPAPKPIHPSTLKSILHQGEISLEELLKNL